MKKIIFGLTCCVVLLGCIDPPNYSTTPKLEYRSIDKMLVDELVEELNITFYFEDGDGDIGLTEQDTFNNLFLIDSRTGFPVDFRVPNIPPNGGVADIRGTIVLTKSDVNCIGTIADTLTYDIYMIDKAGNQSNVITTDTVVVNCM